MTAKAKIGLMPFEDGGKDYEPWNSAGLEKLGKDKNGFFQLSSGASEQHLQFISVSLILDS